MIFIGIDPGLMGAVAVIGFESGIFSVFDTPVLVIKKGKGFRREYDVPGMVKILQSLPFPESVHCTLESIHAMPGQGVTSMYSIGIGMGLWRGILTALKIPHDLVTPQRWKKAMMDGMGKEKDASRLRASQLFPLVDLSSKKDHGRAEALLLAEYGRRMKDGQLDGISLTTKSP